MEHTQKKAIAPKLGIFLDGELCMGARECSVEGKWVRRYVLEFTGEAHPNGFRPHKVKLDENHRPIEETVFGHVEIKPIQ